MAAKSAASVENRYVRVAGTPDRESGLEIDTKGSWVFSQFFRVLGTGDRLFLHRRESPLPAARAEVDQFEGRLIRFGELPFAEAIRAYFAKHVTATHVFAPEVFARAVAGRAGAGRSASPTAPGTPCRSWPTRRSRSRSRNRTPSRSAFPAPASPPRPRPGRRWSRGAARCSPRAAWSRGCRRPDWNRASCPAPPRRRSAGPSWRGSPPARRQAALDEIGEVDRQVEIRDARETVTARLADLAAAGDGLVVHAAAAPERRLAAAEIAAVRTLAPVVIPDDAYLLVEGDRPREHVATIFFALMLVMFGTVNVMGLIRTRDRGRAGR